MKNKNHFFYSYCGNKRNEMKEIMDSIKDNNVEYIVEPFCGSCSFSYHMSLLHPNKYTYILNDNDKLLIELFNTIRDPVKLVEFETKINDICLTLNKDKYKELDINTLVGYYIKHKIYTMHPSIWRTTYKYKYIKISDAPFYNFLVNEHIIFTCDDGLTTYLKYKNENAIIFVDPPYLNASNGLYTNPSGNIYEYLFNNNIKNENAKIVLCLEYSWLIKLLFKDNTFILYDKKYEIGKKRKTIHTIITNKQ